ncbi:MAG TPA: SSI family serine proteinase inhibitor [Gaiellaceae bacterium]
MLVLLVAAGCGGSTNVAGEDLQAPTEPRYDLTITYWPKGKDGPSSKATLTCAPNGGTHPDPDEACAALAAHPEALHPVPLDFACTEIYGGDQVALVTGAELRAVFNRTNGCEIERWDALAPLLEFKT